MKVSVSYLKSKYKKSETIKKIDESIADFLHVDLMDGNYVPEKNFTVGEVINDLNKVSIPLDVHLMVKNPEKYINKLALLNIEYITFHLEATKNPQKVIELIHDAGINAGIALNPEDDLSLLDDYINDIDLILFMSVHPGRGGQEFIPSVCEKIKKINNPNILLSIDGGINEESLELLKDINLDIIVSGSFICMSDNFNEKIEYIKNYK